MFDQARFDSMPKYNHFNYWFYRQSDTVFSYSLRESAEGTRPEIIGTFDSSDLINTCPTDVSAEFINFQSRPEFAVGKKADIVTSAISVNSQEHMIDMFEEIVVGLTFIRCHNAGRNPDDAFASATRFLTWLCGTDFYSCPGSTRFHDAEPTGLLFHSLNVYNNMLELRQLHKFSNVPYHSIALISLSHDFTKIGNYESYLRNVKDENTGKWEQVPAFRWKENPFPFGHGVASMYIVMQFYKLSIEEMLAIRWHMGEYRVAPNEAGELEDACEKYPMVRMVQFADQLACVKY